MQFRRIDNLPPYVFAEVNKRRHAARQSGVDVIDLGFGNPDIPSPPGVVDKLIEASSQGKNHRYSASRGIPNLRKAVADRYARAYGVTLDPETEVINTIGAKEGLSHLMWTLVQAGDVALVPEPSYPIHIYAPVLAGAEVRRVHLSTDSDFFDRLTAAFRTSWPKPRVIVTSFPHNPTTVTVDTEFFKKLVDFAHRNEVALVHDFAYADIAFDGSMAGWRVGFVVGNAEMVAALQQLKSYLDYGTFQPIQIAGIIALNEHDEYIGEVVDEYSIRRDVLIDGLRSAGWEVDPPAATMFVWARIPESHRHMGSLAFALDLLDNAQVAVSPGIGFGPSGDDHVRFALVENAQRISQAVRNIKRYLSGDADVAT
jgi:alanine-synthesizing transaminase